MKTHSRLFMLPLLAAALLTVGAGSAQIPVAPASPPAPAPAPVTAPIAGGGLPGGGELVNPVTDNTSQTSLWLAPVAEALTWEEAGTGWQARVLFTPNDKRIKADQDFDVYLAGVTPKGSEGPKVAAGKWAVEFQRGDDKKAPQVLVTLNKKDGIARAPDAVLTLRLRPKDFPFTEEDMTFQDTNLEIVRPYGQLKIEEGILKVKQTVWPFIHARMPGHLWPDEVHDHVGSLVVAETGHRVALTGVTVEQIAPVATEGGEPTARLEAKVTGGLTIPAGEPTTIDLKTTGAFPLGDTEGKLRIKSPNLEAAQVVTFQVATRVTSWFILALSLAGFGLGYLVRTKWSGEIDRAAAAKKLLRACVQMKADYHGVKDEGFNQLLADQIKGLEAISKTKASKEELEQAQAEAGKKVEEAWADLNQRLKAAAAQIDPWRPLMAAAVELPPAQAEQWQAAKAAFHHVTAGLAAMHPDGASEKLHDFQGSHILPLLRDLADWRGNVPELITALERHPDATASQEIADLLKQWKSDWLATYSDTPVRWSLTHVDAATAADELTASQRAYTTAARKIVATHGYQLKELTQARSRSLREKPGLAKAAAAADKIDAATNAYARTVAEAFALPISQAREKLSAALTELKAQYLGALLSLTDDAALQNDIKTHVSAGKLSDAVAAVTGVPMFLAAAGGGGPGAAAGPRPLTIVMPAAAPLFTFGTAAVEAESARLALQRLSHETFRRRILQLDAEVSTLTCLRTAVVAILFGLLAMGLFHEKWVGTWPDQLAVIFWAFATDITVAKLVANIGAAPFLKKFGDLPLPSAP